LLEKDIEKRFVTEAKKAGCLIYKFVSPGNTGVPDRILITPEGRVWFVELKTDIGRLSVSQAVQIGRLKRNKANVLVIRGMQEMEAFMEVVRNGV